MSAVPAPPLAPSPLGRLPREDRERVIAAIAGALPPADAFAVLALLAGPPAEATILPDDLQDAAQIAILDAFPAGHGAVTVSRLGIARVATESWLPQLRERFSGMGTDAVADALQEVLHHRRAEHAGLPSPKPPQIDRNVAEHQRS